MTGRRGRSPAEVAGRPGATAATARDLRHTALHRVLALAEADFALCFQLYERDGRVRHGDLMACGPGLPPTHGGPSCQPDGDAQPGPAAPIWRRDFQVRLPPRERRNRFSRFEPNADRDDVRCTPAWRELAGPLDVGDHVRALMDDDRRCVGWIGAFRYAGAPPFGPEALARLNAADDELRHLLVTAAARQDAELGGGPHKVVVDGHGHVEHATADAAAWLTPERREALRPSLRHAEALASPRAVTAVCDGVEQRVVRLDHGREVRYLVVLQPAVPVALSPLHVLTASQRRVADLAAHGASVGDVAQALGVSANTVKFHLKHIYAALGVAGRAELAALWFRQPP